MLIALAGFFFFLAGMQSQIVCHGCRNILLYPRGAPSVCCAVCHAVSSTAPSPGNGTSKAFVSFVCAIDHQGCKHWPEFAGSAKGLGRHDFIRIGGFTGTDCDSISTVCCRKNRRFIQGIRISRVDIRYLYCNVDAWVTVLFDVCDDQSKKTVSFERC